MTYEEVREEEKSVVFRWLLNEPEWETLVRATNACRQSDSPDIVGLAEMPSIARLLGFLHSLQHPNGEPMLLVGAQDQSQESLELMIWNAMTDYGQHEVDDAGEHSTQIGKMLSFYGFRRILEGKKRDVHTSG